MYCYIAEVISVITAALPTHVSMLPSAASSLSQQEIAWEWIVQFDGADMSLPFDSDSRVRVEANGARLGTSATRNRALLRARGARVMSLDADDELLPGGLLALAAAMDATPDARYAIGRSLDFFPDGRRIDRFAAKAYSHGVLPSGMLEKVWRETKNLHLQPGAAMYDRQALLSLGGWPAISGMEDQDLLLAFSSHWSGVYVDEPVYLYRQHPGQTVRTQGFERSRELHRRWSDARLRARRLLAGEDPAAVDALEVPLPTAEEIAGFTTAEWKAARVDEAEASGPVSVPASLDFRVRHRGGHKSRIVTGSRLEIEQRNRRLPAEHNFRNPALGNGWAWTSMDIGAWRAEEVDAWDLEIAEAGVDLRPALRASAGLLLPTEALNEVVQLAEELPNDFMPWHAEYKPEVPQFLASLGVAWFDVLLPSVNWRCNDNSVDPVVHWRRGRLVWSSTWLVTIWTASDGVSDSRYKTWGLPDRGPEAIRRRSGVDALTGMLSAVVDHLVWSTSSVDDEMESWENEFLHMASKEGPLFIGPDLGRMQRHLAGLGQGISLNREAARTLVRRVEVQGVPTDCAEEVHRRCGKVIDRCEKQRTRLREEFDLLESAMSGQHFRLAQERASRDGSFQAAIGLLAALFVAPGLVAAFYGANVRGLPGLEDESGLWFMALGAGISGVLSLAVIFAVRIWAGRRRGS